LLLTAIYSANEVASDDAPKAETPSVSAPLEANEQDSKENKAEVTPVDEPPSRTTPPRRVEYVVDKDPDLTAAATLAVDEHETAAGRPGAFDLQFVRAEQRFGSQGNDVRMEILRPDSDQKRPAILILHGASGIGDGAFYRSAAEVFAERGYVTFLPHYLAASPAKTGPTKEPTSNPKKPAAKNPPKTPTKAAAKDPTPNGNIRAGFTVQEKILLDALEQIAANPYVDASRIGVFGMSLGGFHALNLSARDARIAAVVNMAGALRGNNMPERIAPTLALHGAKDSVVPVGRARTLTRQLKDAGIAHDLVIYSDQGHFFRGKARHDAFQRSASFFGQYLDKPSLPMTARPASGGE
jgi:dienelactone hydrolase